MTAGGLIVGGIGSTGPLALAELYDPSTGTGSITNNMLQAHSEHSASHCPTGECS